MPTYSAFIMLPDLTTQDIPEHTSELELRNLVERALNKHYYAQWERDDRVYGFKGRMFGGQPVLARIHVTYSDIEQAQRQIRFREAELEQLHHKIEELDAILQEWRERLASLTSDQG